MDKTCSNFLILVNKTESLILDLEWQGKKIYTTRVISIIIKFPLIPFIVTSELAIRESVSAQALML